MSSCEKCWEDSYKKARELGVPQCVAYELILEERKDNPCSPQEQAGQFWDEGKQKDRRDL